MALTATLQASWVLKTFVFFFLLATISSGIIFGGIGALYTILLTSLFLAPKLISWSDLPYDKVIFARLGVVSGMSIVVGILVSRERNTRVNVQELNKRMGEIILEKDKFIKLASDAQENERRRISRDLHDDSLQLLATVMLQLDGAIGEGDPEKARTQMLRAKETISQTTDAIRRYCEELRPMLLDSLGLIPSVERMAKELEESFHIKVNFETTGQARPFRSQDMIHVFRVMQEAFNNIKKYSKATAVRVLWKFSEEDIEISVTDNGIGIWSLGPNPARSLGIQGMYERMELIGGKLTIESQPGFGTKISLHVPLD